MVMNYDFEKQSFQIRHFGHKQHRGPLHQSRHRSSLLARKNISSSQDRRATLVFLKNYDVTGAVKVPGVNGGPQCMKK